MIADSAFRLLTFNIHRGKGAIRPMAAEVQINALIEEHNPDVICLQEVWRQDFIRESDLEKLCLKRWKHQCFGKNALFPKGSQGNAILSKKSITSWKNHDSSVYGKEPRGILHASLEFGATILHLFCVHFGLHGYERRSQVQHLLELIDHTCSEGPVIVAGDFNDWTKSMCRRMDRSGFQEAHYYLHQKMPRTFPAILPLLSLDRIYFRKLIPKKVSIPKGFWNPLSDHLPYLVDFQLT